MKNLTVSLIQGTLYWEQIDANLAMFEEKICSIETTDLVILPEMFTTGFSMNPKNFAEPSGGKTYQWMRHMAIQKQSAVVGSYIIKERGNYYNRLHFVFPDGSSKQYNKRHLFRLANEEKKYTAGLDRIVIEYKGWKICPLICYDLRFPVWSRARKSAERAYEYDLLLYIANWPDIRINIWDTLLEARAIENSSYVAGVNRVGVDAFKKNYPGHSGVYSALGEKIAFSKSEEIINVELSAEELHIYRKNFPFQLDTDNFDLASINF